MAAHARLGLAVALCALFVALPRDAGATSRTLAWFWTQNVATGDYMTNLGSCQEAVALQAQALNPYCANYAGGTPGPGTPTYTPFTCPATPYFSSYDFRCTNFFPSTPNHNFSVSAYCDGNQGYIPTYDGTNHYYYCPGQTPDPDKMTGRCKTCSVGNPVYPGASNKFQEEVDYVGKGPFPLRFARYFNSRGFDNSFANLAMDWTHSYSMRLISNRSMDGAGPPMIAAAQRPDGKFLTFLLAGGVWVSDGDVDERLEKTATGWKLTLADDTVELYDANGKIQSITNRMGLTQTVSYFSSGVFAGYLSGVTDPFGRTLGFLYDTNGRLRGFVDPAGKQVTWTVSSASNLITRTDQAGSVRQYKYEDAANNNQYSLTGIVDELGNRFATYTYNPGSPGNRGVAWFNMHANEAEKIQVGYYDANKRYVATYMDDGGTYGFRDYLYQPIQGEPRLLSITGDPCPECGPTAMTYDTNANVSSSTDWNGNRTSFTYDLTRNLETSRVEGLRADGGTTSATRTTSSEWHPTLRLPKRVAEPRLLTTFVYNALGASCGGPTDAGALPGVACSVTQQETTDATGAQGFSATTIGTPRTWTLTYDVHGQLATVDGPRTDVTDSTVLTYYADDATCAGSSSTGCRGQLQAVANALGQVTQYLEYDVHGNATKVVDPNGVTTTLAYDVLQRLTSKSANGETTTYTYDAASNLTGITLPDGSFLHFAYDAAHRLTDITDNLNNRIKFTLDLQGNRIKEDVLDPSSTLVRTTKRVVSKLNRVTQVVGAQGQTTSFVYDAQRNLISVTDPLNRTTTRVFDPLNRLIKSTDPANGVTQIAYDARDRVTSLVDPKMIATVYTYDGFGGVTAMLSADQGAVSSVYDSAGNLVSYTDAKGQQTALAYDALNRVSGITYADSSQVAYAYDQGANGVGRLSSVTDSSGSRAYSYDPMGRLLSDTQSVSVGGNAVQLAMGYSYDLAGRLSKMTYPSGRVVSYSYDPVGRIGKIDVSDAGTVADQLTYRPFGPMASFKTPSGATLTRTFDLDGRMTSFMAAGKAWNLTYDPASQITSIADTMNAMDARTYGYDALGRVVSAVTPAGLEAFTYDANGNRLMSLMSTLTYGGTDNRLMSVSGAMSRSYTYDANGSPTSDGTRQFTFDARGRMVKAVNGPLTADYVVNSSGQRVGKAVSR